MHRHEAPWGVIFDVDGTMVDNAAYHRNAWLEFGRRRNVPIDADYYWRHIHSRSNEDIVRIIFGPDVDARFGREVGHEKESIYRQLYRPHVKPLPGLLRLLRELRDANIPCAAASNSPLANVTMVLEALEVTHHFEAVIAQAIGIVGKPDPYMLFLAADHMAVPRDRCIILEDSHSGFNAALNAGIPFVAIEPTPNDSPSGPAEHAVALHRDFEDITPQVLRSYLEAAREEARA